MKSFIFLSVLCASSALAESRLLDMHFSPKISDHLCTYQTTLTFPHFPDVEFYKTGDQENVMIKASATVKMSVEALANGSYNLTVFASPGVLDESGVCPALHGKLLVR